MVKQALYDQLVDILKDKIENEYVPDSKLPSERELSYRYGLSRTTVRTALIELEKMGYIYKIQGKGTFASSLFKNTTNIGSMYSFTEHMKSVNKEPRTVLLHFKVVKANKYFSKKLQVNIGESLYKIKRLRLSDGIPMMLERTYLPKKKFNNLNIDILKSKPLYDIFRDDYSEIIKFANEDLYASIARNKDVEHLGINESAPVLNLSRTTYNIYNEVIEFTLSVARSDKFHYRITHIREK